MSEPLLMGWKNIHKLFCTQDGERIMSESTLRQKYGPELQELGVVFRYNIGKSKRPVVAAWPSKIRNWWTRKQQEMWVEKNV